MADKGIKNSWSLMAFAKMKGQMKVGTFKDPNTNENFKSCIFVDEDKNNTFVGFSSKMGELTPREIAAQKNDLQVVQLESGTYKLCKAGENGWEDVAL